MFDDTENDENFKHLLALEIINSDKKFVCALCNKIYIYRKIFGKLSCNYHPGCFDPYSEVYLCCGQSENKKGCTKCDHSDTGVFAKNFKSVLIEMYSRGIYKSEIEETNEMFTKGGISYVNIKISGCEN